MSRIRADKIVNRAGTGAPEFPNGIVITGIATATTLNQNGNTYIFAAWAEAPTQNLFGGQSNAR